MKRTQFLLCLVLAAVAVAPVALARQVALGTKLTSSGTSVSATVGCGNFAIWCDAAACETSGFATATATCTLGTAAQTGAPVSASTIFDEQLPCNGGDKADTIAIVSVTGTANCEVQRVSL